MVSAVICRTLPWGSHPSSCQGPVRFFVDVAYRAPLVDSRGSCVPVQGHLSVHLPAVTLPCCPPDIRRLRFNDLYHFRAHRVDARWRTGYLQKSLWCSSCMAPDLSADHFKEVGKLPMWTSGRRVCANEPCCGQTPNWESRSWTSSVHSQRSTVAHKLFFKPALVDRQLARRGSNQRLWTGSLRRATPSRRAARGHLTHVRGATCKRTTRARAKKLGTSCS